jgi:RNA polymerase sigma factor (sigma-70 family)
VVTGVCMATANLHDFLRRLARGMDAEMLGQESDRHLVERALGQRDAAALQAIVHRHGAMVYRVCLRVLQDTQDTEDAFQATFLVLAQKLRTVRKHASLASWLHGVAYRVSVKTKIQAAARHRHESRASLSDTMPPEDITLKESVSVLDAELSLLPDKWRLPLVLCYLEGRTQDEAAKRLMWSKSTLRSRLEEARDALARRLTARGITLPAALSAVLLSECIASAMPAPGLVARAVEAAADIAAGKTLATTTSATIAALTEGVLKTTFMTKPKTVTLVAIVVVTTAIGAFSIPALQATPTHKPQEPDRSASSQEPGATEAKATDKNDDRLDGRRWVGVSAEVDGVTCRRSGQPGVPPPSYWELKDGGCVKAQKERDQKYPNEVTFRFKYKLDAAAQPKAIDLIPEEGPARGKTLRGIYSLDSDELKICYVSPNTPEPEKKPRPGELAAKKDSGYVLLVFRDLDGIGHHWKGIAAEVDGAWVPPPPLWGFHRAGGGIGIRDEYRPHESPNEVVFVFKHKLDRATTPKSIDLIPQEGPAKGKTLRGIYSLEGDQLKICYVSPSIPEPEKKARPSEFAAKKGSGNVLLVFRRHSLALDASVLDKAGFDKAELEWARGVLAAAREHDVTCTKSFHEAWGKEMDKAERWVHIWAMAKNLEAEDALPAKVRHPIANQVGKAAPELEGIWHNTAKPLTWNDLKGKVVLLDFISEGFEPCVKNLPKVKALHEQFHDKGLVVISVLAKRVEKGPSTVPAFVKNHAIAFPVMVDPAEPGNPGKTFKRYGIRMMPTYILVDGMGNVVPRDGLQFQDVPTADEIKKLLGP